MHSCYLGLSVVMKKHHDHSNSYKKNIQLVLAYSFRGLVHYHHGGTWQFAGRYGAGEGVENLQAADTTVSHSGHSLSI